MSKMTKVLIALVAIATLATPAMAEFKLGGYFRTQMTTMQFNSDSSYRALLGTDTKTGKAINVKDGSMIDQRVRFKMTYDFNEFIKVVDYTEIDTPWGQDIKGGDAKFSADATNIETKNIYLDVKIPNSIFRVRLGEQGFGAGFEGAIIADDMAGLQVNARLSDNADVTLAYFKGDEGDVAKSDDHDVYILKANFTPNDQIKLGGVVLLDKDASKDTVADDYEVVIYGVKGAMDLGAAQLSGFVATSTGSNGTLDQSGYMATVKAATKLGKADIGARFIYYSSDDDATDGDQDNFFGDVSNADGEFAGEHSLIFLSTDSINNATDPRLALKTADRGFGLAALVVNGGMKYDNGMYSKFGVGYYTALEDNIKTGATTSDKLNDKDLGLELDATIGTKVAEKVDVSLNAGYAVLGDAFKVTGDSNADDAMYVVNLMVNVPF